MTMEKEPNATEIIDGVGRNLDRFLQSVVATRSADSNRMIWYVGIAGYVLVNAPMTWRTLIGRDLKGNELLWLSVPWVVAALVALIANLVMDGCFERESLQYHAQRVSIDSLLVTETDPKRAVERIGKILDCADDTLKGLLSQECNCPGSLGAAKRCGLTGG
jgi:hypothetical protein